MVGLTGQCGCADVGVAGDRHWQRVQGRGCSGRCGIAAWSYPPALGQPLPPPPDRHFPRNATASSSAQQARGQWRGKVPGCCVRCRWRWRPRCDSSCPTMLACRQPGAWRTQKQPPEATACRRKQMHQQQHQVITTTTPGWRGVSSRPPLSSPSAQCTYSCRGPAPPQAASA